MRSPFIWQNDRILRYFAVNVLIALFATFSNNAIGQVASNEGTEFWIAFPSHEHDYDQAGEIAYPNMSIFITAKMSTSGRITAGTFSKQFNITANGIAEIQIPFNIAYIDISQSGKVLPNKAIHVLIDDGKPPVVVFAHIFAAQRSAAALILPGQTLSNRYYSINYKPSVNGKSFITIVATKDQTKVHIRKNNNDLIKNGIVLEHANDVYQYISADDLSGISVETEDECHPVAVFSGTTASAIGYNSVCESKTLDPLYQQLYPVESWGTEYGFIPFSQKSINFNHPVRSSGQYLRILASDDNTHVYIDGSALVTLNKGEYYTTDKPLNRPAYIKADKPVCVAQYSLSQSCSNIENNVNQPNYSDPDMVILNPFNYSINNITLFSSDKENISEKYINVLIKTNAASSFKINGVVPLESFSPIPTLPGYSYTQIDLTKYTTNTFNLEANDGFNSVAYGFGDVESYAYSAGTNLASSKAFSAISAYNNKIITSACLNDDYFFRLTLPYAATKLSWKMDDNEPAVVQINPSYQIKNVNGRVIYEYELKKTPAYGTPGLHKIAIIASSSIELCGGKHEEKINSVFLVNAVPKADFVAKKLSCENIFSFSDFNNPDDSSVHRNWDFGDHSISLQDNQSDAVSPVHLFKNPGTYTVKLTVTNASGCSTISTSTLQVTTEYPKVKFSKLATVCYDAESFKLTQGSELNGAEGIESYSGKGVINGWYNPSVAGVGNHLITYKFINKSGCIDSAVQTIEVEAPPEVSLNDKITIIRGQTTVLKPLVSDKNFTYLWTPNQGLNDDKIKNPVAAPTEDIIYTLTVTGYACNVSKTISVTVLDPIEIFNTFTPNNDGVNDTWSLKGIEQYPRATVAIYNRLGSLIFFSKGYKTPWDGKKDNNQLPAGTYYYIITPDDYIDKLSGFVTIIR